MIDRLAISQVVILAAWLGAVLLVGTVVAPAAFAALPSRALAGAVVGRVLPPIFLAGGAIGLFLVASRVAGPTGLGRPIAGGVLVLSCAISHLVVGARISALRQAIGPSLDALNPGDPRRVMFGRLHALSVAGLGVGVLAALVALGLAIAALHRRPGGAGP